MSNTYGSDALKIHSAVWEEDEKWIRIRLSLLDSTDVDEIFISDDGISYHEEGTGGISPYYIDAPNIISNAFDFPTMRVYQIIFKPLLFSVIYPYLIEKMRMLKMNTQEEEEMLLQLVVKINNLILLRTKIAHFDDENIPIEKMYRLHLEGMGMMK